MHGDLRTLIAVSVNRLSFLISPLAGYAEVGTVEAVPGDQGETTPGLAGVIGRVGARGAAVALFGATPGATFCGAIFGFPDVFSGWSVAATRKLTSSTTR